MLGRDSDMLTCRVLPGWTVPLGIRREARPGEIIGVPASFARRYAERGVLEILDDPDPDEPETRAA